MPETSTLSQLLHEWASIWPKALELWSPYIKLREPIFCLSLKEEIKAHLSDSFAMIRLNDLSVVISLNKISELKLTSYPLEILAHEIGHHVYAPADLSDLARMTAVIRKALPTVENMASFVGNLYSDLLINDRLVRVHQLNIADIYKTIKEPNQDLLWNFYMRIYEILWGLPQQTLTTLQLDDETEADAILGNRLIRNYANDWLKGAGKFAALCLTYLLKQKNNAVSSKMQIWLDTTEAGGGEIIPHGLSGIDFDEETATLHPALDEKQQTEKATAPNENNKMGNSGSNYREPFEYGEIIKSMGIELSDIEITIQYYKERALPYLIPFPQLNLPASTEPLAEGLENWEIGDALEKINWLESIYKSPLVIPGITTVQRVYGNSQGNEPQKEPIDLDIYVDCSGSMPNPAYEVSYLTLAGAIISLSALRSGSAVQATLWSGTNQFYTTSGFTRNEKEILKVLTDFIGGATAFPIHILRNTFKNRKKTDRKVHILVISDDGVTTLFNKDELGGNGEDVATNALEKGGAGGTFVLNLYQPWQHNPHLVKANKMGFDIYAISNWGDLIDFSKQFCKKHYTGDLI